MASTSASNGSPSRSRSTSTALAYLSDNGFVPGADARVASRAPDGTLTLDVGEHTIALGPVLAGQLYVSAGAAGSRSAQPPSGSSGRRPSSMIRRAISLMWTRSRMARAAGSR